MVFKAAQRVEGHDAAGQFQPPQQLGHGGDFVAFLRSAKLAEHEPVAHRPGADQMHGALPGAAAAAQGLAVERDDFARQALAQTLGPKREGLGELRGVQRGENPPESVVAGDAVGQFEQPAQPLPLRFAKLLHVHEALGSAEQRADRDDQDVVKAMAFATDNPWVFELVEAMAEAGMVGHPKLLPTSFAKVHF